jgi:4-azaleucine resistance transporter AzlC
VSRRREIAEGLRLSAPAGLGLVPLGIAYGMLVVQSGLKWWVAPALSIAVYAGSVELLLTSMVAATTPLATVALTVLLVNFRHVFYAFSFPRDVVRSRVGRLYSTYALTDESYALTAAHPEGWTGPRLVTVQAAFQSYWVGGGVIGALVASALPRPIRGLEFALVALFVTLTLDACRSRAQIPSLAMAAAAFLVAMTAAPSNALFTAMVVFVGTLVVRFALVTRGRGDAGNPGGTRRRPASGSTRAIPPGREDER